VAAWCSGQRVGRDQRSYSTPGPVSTWMGDRLRTGKPSRYVTSHRGQHNLAIPPWVGAMSTSETSGVNRHTARYTSSLSVVSQCQAGVWLRGTEISAALWALWLGKDFTLSLLSNFLFGCIRKRGKDTHSRCGNNGAECTNWNGLRGVCQVS